MKPTSIARRALLALAMQKGMQKGLILRYDCNTTQHCCVGLDALVWLAMQKGGQKGFMVRYDCTSTQHCCIYALLALSMQKGVQQGVHLAI